MRQLSNKQLPSNMRDCGWPLDEEAQPCPDVVIDSQPPHGDPVSRASHNSVVLAPPTRAPHGSATSVSCHGGLGT